MTLPTLPLHHNNFFPPLSHPHPHPHQNGRRGEANTWMFYQLYGDQLQKVCVFCETLT